MTDKRALRFTGDACEQLLIPWAPPPTPPDAC